MKGKRPDYSVSTVIPTENGDRWREIEVREPLSRSALCHKAERGGGPAVRDPHPRPLPRAMRERGSVRLLPSKTFSTG